VSELTKRNQRSILVGILLLALGLRVFRLTANSLWLDEGWSVWLATQPRDVILSGTAAAHVHAPLYYLILHGWMATVGRTEAVVRFPSVIFGVLSVGFVYLTVGLLWAPEVALTAAFLQAVSPLDVWYSQEAGRFALGNCLALASVYLLVRALRSGSWRFWLTYALIMTTALYTLYPTSAILWMQDMYLIIDRLWFRRHIRWTVKWLVSQIAIVGLFLPWLPSLSRQTRQLGGMSLLMNAQRMLESIGFDTQITKLPLSMIVVIGAMVTLGLVMTGRTGERVVRWLRGHPRLVTFCTCLLYTGVIILSSLRPISSIRLGLVFVPLLLILVAVIIWKMAIRRNFVIGFLLFLTVASLSTNYFVTRKEAWREAVRALGSQTQPGDIVLLHPGYIHYPIDFYRDGFSLWHFRTTDIRVGLEELPGTYRRVWLVSGLNYLKYVDPTNQVQKQLDEQYELMTAIDFHRISIRQYLVSTQANPSD